MFIRHVLFVTAKHSEKYNSPFSTLSGDSCLCYFNYRLGLRSGDFALPPCGFGATQTTFGFLTWERSKHLTRPPAAQLTYGDGPILLEMFRYCVIWLRHPYAYRMTQRWPESRDITRAGDVLVNYSSAAPNGSYVVLGALRHYEPTELRSI